MHRTLSTVAIFACMLVACDDAGPREELGGVRAPPPPVTNTTANAAAASPRPANEIRRETISGRFAGWEMGDYLWARFEVTGREPVRAMVEGDALGLFLDAHRGETVTAEIATVMMEIPEAGGETEIARVVSARDDDATAEQWLARLSPSERQAARQRFERNALSGGGR